MRGRQLGRDKRASVEAQQSRIRSAAVEALLWTAVASLIFGLIGAGEYFEDILRVARNNLHMHRASGQVVIIKIDDDSLRQYGNWPWPRRYHGALVDRLSAGGANGIFFDINFSYPSDPDNDRAFAASDQALRSGHASLALQGRPGTRDQARFPASAGIHEIRKQATLSVQYNYQSAVLRLPYAVTIRNRTVPSFAAALAKKTGPERKRISRRLFDENSNRSR